MPNEEKQGVSDRPSTAEQGAEGGSAAEPTAAEKARAKLAEARAARVKEKVKKLKKQDPNIYPMW